MKAAYAALLAAALPLGVARADALLEVAAHAPPRPASQLVETACEVDVDVRGGLATVELRQHLANQGATPVGAAYELSVPAGAALVGAAVRDGSGPEASALAVPDGFATALAREGDAIGADPLLVTAGDADGARPGFRALLQPLAPGHAALLTLRWAAPVTIEGGALRVTVPGRAGAGALPACQGSLRAAAGPGATIARVHAGATAGTGGAVAFALGDEDMPLAAELAFARPEPLAWTQREDLGGGWAAELVTVVAPPARSFAPAAHRALFVIDGSRSMAMIGPAAVTKVVDAVAAALPAGTELDALVYDRAATRVLGTWQPADRAAPAIAAAVGHHVATNGSDLAGALRVARDVLASGARGQTSLIVITDGVLGQLPDTALVDALGTTPSDVHAIVLDPGPTRSPGRALLARPIAALGGSYVETSVDDLDAALAGVDAWVRPAWSVTAARGVPDSARGELPTPLRAGAGGTQWFVAAGAGPSIGFELRGELTSRVVARPAAGGGVGAFVLAGSAPLDFARPGGALDRDAAVRARDAALRAHPAVDGEHALVALAATSKLAGDRRALVASGGPYTRIAALPDPAWEAAAPRARPAAAPSAIDRLTIARLFRDQLQPAAYACYERALGAAPALAGTVTFDLHLARGEVTLVSVAGLGNAAFDACLVDAAYRMTPPLPDLAQNADDQTRVHYPLSFRLADRHPVIVAGDADSSSPVDIDGIEGGVPTPGKPVRVDASTPLGGLRPD